MINASPASGAVTTDQCSRVSSSTVRLVYSLSFAVFVYRRVYSSSISLYFRYLRVGCISVVEKNSII